MAGGSTAGLIDLTNDQAADFQVIDLTASPSPPPPSHLAINPLKTPVCIGQLHVNALVLHHVQYLFSRDPELEYEWAAVRLQPDPHGPETIHLTTPAERTPTGGVILGEEFGVLEQRAAKHISMMLNRGVVLIEAKIRRRNLHVRSFLSFVLLAQACSRSSRPGPCHADAFHFVHRKGKH